MAVGIVRLAFTKAGIFSLHFDPIKMNEYSMQKTARDLYVSLAFTIHVYVRDSSAFVDFANKLGNSVIGPIRYTHWPLTVKPITTQRTHFTFRNFIEFVAMEHQIAE